MSLGFRAESTNTSGVITVAGADQVVINNAGDVAATTFTGALVGNAATATKLSTATVGTAPSYAARAWVSFSGTQDTTGAVSSANTNRFIYSSGNVTNVLRSATGNYNVFFSTPFPNADYAFSLSLHHPSGVSPNGGVSAYSYGAASLGVFTYYTYSAGAYYDPFQVCVVIYR
jgi:hypothetical protein